MGSYESKPELRPPSLKGVMRYWWRAVNGNLPLKELREQESNIFGASSGQIGKSKFNVGIQSKELSRSEYKPLLEKDFRLTGFNPGQGISITLTSNVNISKFEDILKLSLILGGLGRRTRRGCGSLKLSNQEFELEDILELINSVGSAQYCIFNNRIILQNKSYFSVNYPYLLEVSIGKAYSSWEDLLDRVAQASHECCDDSLGSASQSEKPGRPKKDRLASPLYVSVIKNKKSEYLPIISTLNTVFKNPPKTMDDSFQENFKAMIL